MVGLDGSIAHVPIYSGNAQRNGNLGRRTGIASFLDALEIAVDRATHQTLYSGGYIEGSTINDFEAESKIRQYLPNLSILGGAIPPESLGMPKGKSQMLEGRLNIGDAYLVCYESSPYLYQQCPALIPWECLKSVEAIMQARDRFIELRYQYHAGKIGKASIEEELARLKQVECEHLPIAQYHLNPSSQWWEFRESVRIPSHKQSELRKHLAGGLPLLAGEESRKKNEKDAGRQMISGVWVIHRGAQLYARWSSRGAGITELEEGALVNTLLEFAKQPYLGGKANTGCGLVNISIRYDADGESDNYLVLSEQSQVVGDRAQSALARYQEMISAYKQYIAEIKAGKSVEAGNVLKLLGVS
jgi:hypothetical protein